MIKLRNYTPLFIIAIIAVISCHKEHVHGLAFENAFLYNGQSFESGTFYVVNGMISFIRPGTIDSTINLDKRYVIPPYGEAHNHNVDDYKIEEKVNNYLSKGIYYVKVPNILARSRKAIESKINKPGSINAIFSNGGITSTGGHPIGLADFNIKRGVFKKEDGEGQFYHTVNDTTELQEKWPQILRESPDFIKTYMLYSEEYEIRRNDTSFFAWKGLSPEVLKSVVNKANKMDLRVSVHIETAADFKHAVRAGVDEINHFPGFRPQPKYLDTLSIYIIDEQVARLAEEQDITVVTTLAGLLEEIQEMDETVSGKMMNVLQQNIAILKKYNVSIAIGSDNYGGTSYDEALALSKSGLFTNNELLNMWTHNTVSTIYPSKKLGYLKEGYIANFLVLNENPLVNFKNFQDISMMVKEGKILKTTPNTEYKK